MGFEPKKLAALRILQVLWQYSDAHHPLSQADIHDYLARDYDLELERRAISGYLTELQEAGFEIETGRNRNYLDSRLFDDLELRLLADAIMSSSFISEKASKSLLTKLKSLGSKYLKLHVDHISQVANVNKTDNTTVFYSLATIDDALDSGKCIRFKFFSHDTKGAPEKGKKEQIFSPIRIVMKKGGYYLLGISAFEDEDEDEEAERTFITHAIPIDSMTAVRVDEERDAISLKDIPGFETDGNIDQRLKAHPDMSYLWLDEEDFCFICPKVFLEAVRDYFGTEFSVQELSPCTDKEINKALGMWLNPDRTLVMVRIRTGYMAMRDFALKNNCRVTVVSPDSFAKSMKKNLDRSKILYEHLGEYYK